MIVDGIVVSGINVFEKGVGFTVMCKDLEDTFKVFIPKSSINGEQLLKMGDCVKVDFNEFFPSRDEVRMNVKSVTLDKGKKRIDFKMFGV